MKHMFILLCLIGTFVGCDSSDDDATSDEMLLTGDWSLVNISGGIAGFDEDFDDGVVVWNFNANDFVLTVTNDHPDENTFSGLPSGTYNYSILTTTGEDAHVVIEDHFSMRLVTHTETEMILDDGLVLDGFIFRFQK